MSMNAYTRQGPTVAIAANITVSTPVKVNSHSGNSPATFRVANPDGGVTIYYAWGPTPDDAVNNCVVPTAGNPQACDPLPSGAVEIIRACANAYFAAITISGTGTLYVSTGEGL